MSQKYSKKSGSLSFGIVLILFGVLLLLDQMGIMDFGDVISTFWPLILILIGIKMIFFPGSRSRDASDASCVDAERADVANDRILDEEKTAHHSRVIGDIRTQIDAKDFAGAKYSVTFGDVDIDASEMGISSGQRTLYVNTTFGDIRLHLLQSVPCLIRATCTAGDVTLWDVRGSGLFVQRTFKTTDFDAATNRLIVVLTCVFGDIKVW